ncbi:hypothetical protein NC651_040115 [Populus alba x Populus x berolinensis]|nr:hypothetical protein NC651_040115 [Populus alba x Populus x berolinensis]
MDEPTIIAWELMYEPRCQVDYSGKTINELAPYVKSIDTEFISNHLVRDSDFAILHAYPDIW